MELYQYCLLILGAALFICIIVSYLKNFNYLKYSGIIRPVLTACLGVLNAVKGMQVDNKILCTICTVIEASIKATGYAEELWLNGSIDKENRAEEAEKYLQDILCEAGITITDQIRTIISGTIAFVCFIMPHHKEEE